MTAQGQLEGRDGDMNASGVQAPILFAMLYGVYNFIKLGTDPAQYLYTYVPLFGGTAATVGFIFGTSEFSNPGRLVGGIFLFYWE